MEVNALGYAGMLLVKSENELNVLEQATAESHGSSSDQASGLMRVLSECGVPRDWAVQEIPIDDGALAA